MTFWSWVLGGQYRKIPYIKMLPGFREVSKFRNVAEIRDVADRCIFRGFVFKNKSYPNDCANSAAVSCALEGNTILKLQTLK